MKIGKIDLSHLTKRERWFLWGGGAITLVLLLYMSIWVPLSDQVKTLKESVNTQRALNHWLEASVKQLRTFNSRGVSVQVLKQETLLSTLESLLGQEQLNVYVDKIQERDGEVLISLKDVPFDWLMTWLENIWKNYAVDMSEMHITKGNAEGEVQARLVLRTFSKKKL